MMKSVFHQSWKAIKLLTLIGLMLGYAPSAHATERFTASASSGFKHQFWLYYMTVQHSLKSNHTMLQYASTLNRLSPSATYFIAKYWWKKVERDCKDDWANDPFFASSKRGAFDSVDLMQNVNEDLKYCAYEVLYENWQDINETIVNRLKIEQTNRRAAILASLREMGLTSPSYH